MYFLNSIKKILFYCLKCYLLFLDLMLLFHTTKYTIKVILVLKLNNFPTTTYTTCTIYILLLCKGQKYINLYPTHSDTHTHKS